MVGLAGGWSISGEVCSGSPKKRDKLGNQARLF